MQAPEIPDNEALRLKALSALNVLDTRHEERFDRLTRLASRIFDVPIALVCLVDKDRQWFKSVCGLNASETSRDISFCGHVILQTDLMVIPDALEDKRFHDNPLVTEDPSIRFYAGFPLVNTDGSALGTFCIIDTKPREFSNEDYEALKDLAEMALSELSAIQLATLDDLTGISNRRGFTVLASKSLEVCRRLNKSASLLYLDLDNFKTINDQFGHKAGDTVLQDFASIIKETFRESDVIGRLGGDEFAVLLSTNASDNAHLSINRLQDAVSDHNRSSNKAYDIAFSAGCVEISEEHDFNLDTILQEADRKMYSRKKLNAVPAAQNLNHHPVLTPVV